MKNCSDKIGSPAHEGGESFSVVGDLGSLKGEARLAVWLWRAHATLYRPAVAVCEEAAAVRRVTDGCFFA